MAKSRSRSRSAVSLQGSAIPKIGNTKVLQQVPDDDQVDVTLHLRHRRPLPSFSEFNGVLPSERNYLTAEEFEREFGADPKDLQAVEVFAKSHGFTKVETHGPSAMVELFGPASACKRAFGVSLDIRRDGRSSYRGYSGSIRIPRELDGIVEAVLGMDSRSAIARVSREPPPLENPVYEEVLKRYRLYFPTEVAQLYDFPTAFNGSGQTIAVIELGGGYHPSDNQLLFTMEGIQPPEIVDVPIGSGRNAPHTSNVKYDLESALDIQIAGSMAPGAKIVVYFANGQRPRPLVNALNFVIHDKQHRPDIVTISYGGPEEIYSDQNMRIFDRTLGIASLLGITVCVSSGDTGSVANYPANSPFALSCGGTRMVVHDGQITHESVWNVLNESKMASGGGFSKFFGVPDYQSEIMQSEQPRSLGRGIPDVAGVAAITSGYQTVLDGRIVPNGGTSAVAPLWAALIARLNQGLQTNCGFINPVLYRLRDRGVFRDVTDGFNGEYQATKGWDPCTGLGTPKATQLFNALAEEMGKETVDEASTQSGDQDQQSEWVAMAAAAASAAAASAASAAAAAAGVNLQAEQPAATQET